MGLSATHSVETRPPYIHPWPVSDPVAAVHVVHGIVEHGGRYEWFAEQLNAHQIAVWAHDHRGHGKNPDPDLGFGHFGDKDGWKLLVDDTWAVSQALKAAYPRVPIVLFAHSMGSFIAQTLIAGHGTAYSGVVLAGSCGAPDAGEKTVRASISVATALGRGRSRAEFIQKTVIFGTYNRQFRPNRTLSDWLSRDTRKVDEYEADSLCKFVVTYRSWLDFLDGKKSLTSNEHLAKIIPKSLPIYVISGSCDPVGRNAKGVQDLVDSYRSAGFSNVSCKLYPEARHELVNEINRKEVVDDLVDWIEALV